MGAFLFVCDDRRSFFPIPQARFYSSSLIRSNTLLCTPMHPGAAVYRHTPSNGLCSPCELQLPRCGLLAHPRTRSRLAHFAQLAGLCPNGITQEI